MATTKVLMVLNQIKLSQLSTSWKILITGFVITLSAGYLNGALNAALSVGLTPASISDHYGGQILSESEKTIIKEKGFVEEEVNLDDKEDADNDHVHDGMMPEHEGGIKPVSLQQMAQVAHVHLFGFSLLLLSLGTLTCFTNLAEWLKVLLVGMLGISFLLDIAGLYLVRFVSTNFSWLPVITGITIGICIAFISLRVLYELWMPPGIK
ncbi:MAG: hypothetical protein IT392_08895 [Nitrospirae bacterium]|nr:hypothetical protein [Nitrospirota bacterium]